MLPKFHYSQSTVSGAQSAAPWESPQAWITRSSNVQAGGHGPSMLERSGTSVPRRSLCPTVHSETYPFRWEKSTCIARTTSPTQHVRPPSFCHCPKQSSGPCLQSELHRSCFQAPAKGISVSHGPSAPSTLGGFNGDVLYKSTHCHWHYINPFMPKF